MLYPNGVYIYKKLHSKTLHDLKKYMNESLPSSFRLNDELHLTLIYSKKNLVIIK